MYIRVEKYNKSNFSFTSSDVRGSGHQLRKLFLCEIPWRKQISNKTSTHYTC